MPNLLDANGLQTKTYAEVVSDLTAAFQSIYGADVNLDSNSPDGQLLGIFAQQIVDNLDLQTQIYSSFDPDQAIGTTLDARVALNGIRRKGGTFTQTDVTVVTDRAVTLTGLDSDINNPDPDLTRNVFTVSDSAGNQFYLTNSYSIGAAGSTTLVFRAANMGPIGTNVGSISTPLTVVVGVVSVYNYSAALSIGLPQEQDSAVKVRRKQSVALASSGYYDALIAALLNVDGVTSAQVYENTTGSTNADGVPGHSIWVVVNGGASADIAQAIYSKRNGGAGMYGAQSATVIRTNGSPFVVNWDWVTSQNLYLKFNLDMISGNIITTGTVPGAGGGTPARITAIPSTAGLLPGYLVRGTGVPAGATILTVDSANQVTLSAPTTGAGGVGVTLTFVPVVISDFKTKLAAAIVPGVYQTMDINHVAATAQGINPNVYLTSIGLSVDNVNFFPVITPTTKNRQFSLAAGQISIL